MMNSDEILTQIDQALRDHSISIDAMRWNPDGHMHPVPDPQPRDPPQGHTPTLIIYDEPQERPPRRTDREVAKAEFRKALTETYAWRALQRLTQWLNELVRWWRR